ncbi:MAG TPA: glycosyltransferase [Bryobacteraceae bacterium]|nr:glycosyltransferase [Bryobacteraceae bacterium]
MSSVRSITAVIPNWNGVRYIGDLLDDLGQQTCRPETVLVVDNGSTDGSDLDAERRGAVVMRLGENRGFTVAVNRGVRESKTALVAVLNNDLRLRPDWLERLADTLEASGAPYAVGKVLNARSPQVIDGCFDAISRGGCAWHCGHGRPDGAQWDLAREVLLPPFTAVVLRREFFLSLGGLDEAFGTYLEDVDFGLRSASRGHTGRYDPSAVAYHFGSGTLGSWSNRVVRQISRNQVLIVARHYSWSMLLRFGWSIAVGQLLWGLVALKHGAGLAWVNGKIDGVMEFSSVRREGGGGIARVLGSSEKQLLELQRACGWDLYWRVYSILT